MAIWTRPNLKPLIVPRALSCTGSVQKRAESWALTRNRQPELAASFFALLGKSSLQTKISMSL